MKNELEMILEREVLPTSVSELPMVRRMTLGMNSPLVFPSLHARATVEKQQKEIGEEEHITLKSSALRIEGARAEARGYEDRCGRCLVCSPH